MSGDRITIITGSSRLNKNSCTFARSLKNVFESKGVDAGIFNVMKSFNQGTADPELVSSLSRSTVLVIIAPLYADFLPYSLIWLLEELSEKQGSLLENKKMFGISQCAFPYWELNDASINALKFFAKHCAMKWMGGLRYGGAALIDGKKLESFGNKGKKIIKALDISVESILADSLIPPEAQEMIKIEFPAAFSGLMSRLLNNRIRKLCKSHGVSDPAIRAYLR